MTNYHNRCVSRLNFTADSVEEEDVKPEVPDEDEEEPPTETITDGYFEEEYYVSAENVGEFLADLAEQFKNEDEITITGDDWELPFAFGEPVKLDVEFEGDGELELEIEVCSSD